MNRCIRLLVPIIGLGFALLPSTALASTTYNESVSGIETGIPQSTPQCPPPDSVSPFAGVATGTLTGGFQIAVCHTPLNPSATIEGGTFVISNGASTISGSFAPGGTVTFLGQSVIGSLCVQRFAVQGGLLENGSPAGNFTGTLIHYGLWTGSCNVFFASISGHATVTV